MTKRGLAIIGTASVRKELPTGVVLSRFSFTPLLSYVQIFFGHD